MLPLVGGEGLGEEGTHAELTECCLSLRFLDLHVGYVGFDILQSLIKPYIYALLICLYLYMN